MPIIPIIDFVKSRVSHLEAIFTVLLYVSHRCFIMCSIQTSDLLNPGYTLVTSLKYRGSITRKMQRIQTGKKNLPVSNSTGCSIVVLCSTITVTTHKADKGRSE